MKKTTLLGFILLAFTQVLYPQNVGIGTTSPNEKLQVAGNIKADTIKPAALKIPLNAGDGKILTSDAAGNASWQSKALAAGNVGYGVWGDCAANGNISDYQPVADDNGEFPDKFGNSVAIAGAYAVIGTPGDAIAANSGQGSASIYQNNGSSWVFMQKITDPTGASGDNFGHCVNISGNRVIIGAPNDDINASVNQGSISIFQYNGTSWVLMQKIIDAGGAANDNFGRSVSIYGNFALAGALNDDMGANTNQGSVSFYQFDGANWLLTQKSAEPTGSANDNFGISVSLSGNFAVIGVPGDNVTLSGTNMGSAIIYHYNGSNGWNLTEKLTDYAGASEVFFGTSVSMSGSYLIVGAPRADVGSNNKQGSSSFFRLNGNNWLRMQRITDVDGESSDLFGSAVSISGDYAIVGTPFTYVTNKINHGSATIYQRIGVGWQRLQFIKDPAGNEDNFAGFAVAIDGITKRFMVGAYGYMNAIGKVLLGKVN